MHTVYKHTSTNDRFVDGCGPSFSMPRIVIPLRRRHPINTRSIKNFYFFVVYEGMIATMDRFTCNDDDIDLPPMNCASVTPSVKSCNESLAGMYYIADCDETVKDDDDTCSNSTTLRFDVTAEKRGTGSTTASTSNAFGSSNRSSNLLNYHYAVVTPPSKDLYRMEQDILAKQQGRRTTNASSMTKREIQTPQSVRNVSHNYHSSRVGSYKESQVKVHEESNEYIPRELQRLEHQMDKKIRLDTTSTLNHESRRSKTLLDDKEIKKLASSRPIMMSDEISRLDSRIAAMNSKIRLASTRTVQSNDVHTNEQESMDTPVISNVMPQERNTSTIILKREGSTMVEHCQHPKIEADKDESSPQSAMYQGMNTGGIDNASYGLIPHNDHNSNTDLEFGVYENGPNHKGLAVAFAVNDEEEDMYIPSAVEFDPDAKPSTYKNRRFRFYACLAIIVVIVGTITASVGITLTQGTGTTPVEDIIPYRATLGIRETIERIVGSEKLDDANSPYRKALDWVQDIDPLALLPDNVNFIQRYLAVYFFYATSIKHPWSGGCNPPINGENDTCVYTRLASLDPVTYTEIPWNRWLSKEFECNWAGIFCDDAGEIRSMEFST
jgi:hypothetical protein